MAITLRGKVSKIQSAGDGVQYQTLFVRWDCDLADPEWTPRADEAAILSWAVAEALATRVKGHAVVVAGQAEVGEKVKAMRVVRDQREEERIASYQRELARRHLD